MPHFDVERAGQTRTQQAEDWMDALQQTLESDGLDEAVISRVVCEISADGSIRVELPGDQGELWIRERASAGAAQIRLDQASAQSSSGVRLAQSAHLAEVPDEQDHAQLDAPDPRASAAFDTASEQNEERSMDRLEGSLERLKGAESPDAACDLAIDLLVREIPAESAAILLLTDDDSAFRFVAARGPRAAQVAPLRLPAKAGIAGVCLSSRSALLIREVGHDSRHFRGADEQSGYRTRALVAVPLQGPSGRVHGVLELLNPFGGAAFQDWHLDAAQLVSAGLSSRLG